MLGLVCFSRGNITEAPHPSGSIPASAHRSMTPAGPAPASAPGMLHIRTQRGKDDATPSPQILSLGEKPLGLKDFRSFQRRRTFPKSSEVVIGFFQGGKRKTRSWGVFLASSRIRSSPLLARQWCHFRTEPSSSRQETLLWLISLLRN